MSDTEIARRGEEDSQIHDKVVVDTSDDDSSEPVEVNGGTDDSSSSSAAVAAVAGNAEDDTDSDEGTDEGKLDDHDHDQQSTPDSGFTRDGEQEFKTKKATESDSSDTEDDQEELNKSDVKDSSDEEDVIISAKMEEKEDEDIRDGCISSKEEGRHDQDEVYELSRTPSPIDLMDDTPIMKKSSTPTSPTRATMSPRSPTPEPTSAPLQMIDDDVHSSPVHDPISVHAPLAPLERSPSPERTSSPEEDDAPSSQPVIASRSPSPKQRKSSRDQSEDGSPERKSSSSSYDEERASSLSPEPVKTIQTPSSKVTTPISPPPTSKSALTKIYTDSLEDNEVEKTPIARKTPTGDVTQIYTQKLVEKEEQASSPRTERKSMTFHRPEGMTNITELYTAAFKEEKKEAGGKMKPPTRNGDITKLYTGGFSKDQGGAFKGKPKDELTNPIKHNMATNVDKGAIQEAYNEVMADKNSVEWAAFTFEGSTLGVTAKGQEFDEFKSHFGPDDRGFGYIKIMTGDEMSRRSKFVFCTWVGPNVSVMKKAKMSTDKALLKEIIQNVSVELQIDTANEFTLEHFKTEVDKAGGARYGTGVRDM